jgi:hypothetical protein
MTTRRAKAKTKADSLAGMTTRKARGKAKSRFPAGMATKDRRSLWAEPAGEIVQDFRTYS